MRFLSLGVAILLASTICAEDTAAQKQTQDRLKKAMFVSRSFDGVPAFDVLDFLQDRFEVSIKVDSTSFAAKGRTFDKETVLKTHKLYAATAEQVLLVMTAPIGGDVEVAKDGSVRVIASEKEQLADRLAAPSQEFLDRLKDQVEFDREFSATPLKDVVALISDRLRMTIYVDTASFAKKDANLKANELAVTLKPKESYIFELLLKRVAKQVNAEIVIRDRIVLIVEESEAKKLKKK